MDLEKAKIILKNQNVIYYDGTLSFKPYSTYTEIVEAIKTVLQELERLQKENEELKRQENIRNIEKYNEIEINELIRTTFRNNFINKDRIKTLSNALYNEYNCRILKGESADDTEMLLLRGEYLGTEKILDINY